MLGNIQQFAASAPFPSFFSSGGVFDAVSNVSLFKVLKDMDHANQIWSRPYTVPVMNLANREDIDGGRC